jgi:hypothetical protein
MPAVKKKIYPELLPVIATVANKTPVQVNFILPVYTPLSFLRLPKITIKKSRHICRLHFSPSVSALSFKGTRQATCLAAAKP